MKEFHRNYVFRPTDLDKKGRKHKAHKEACKCFAPFVKLHYHDCPAVKKSCPVHGNNRHHGDRNDKGDPDNSVIISFHPSSKTERLFRPVKTLLARCDPETKINLQYYSPESTTSKETIKHQQVQTNSEDGRKPLNDSVFVEKTKSFAADKTNRMKKLKQCFHSPCNSIAKSRSQTSFIDKFHDIFRDDRKKANDLDSPIDDLKCDANVTWFSSKLHWKNWDKLSPAKTDSDFITVTHQAKNNLISHKIFEIKHRKGLNDYPFLRLPDQPPQMVYSTLDVQRPLQKVGDDPQKRKASFPPSEGFPGDDSKQRRDEDLSNSENSQSSSNSSVYFTPYIFVPAGANSDSDGKPKWADEAVQVGSKERGDGRETQGTQTPSLQSDQDLVAYVEEPQTASVLLQTDPDRQSGDSATQEWCLRPLEVAESFTTRGTQTDESLFRLHKSVGDSRRLSELSSEVFALASSLLDFGDKGTQTSCSPTDSGSPGRGSPPSGTRTVEVQTDSRSRREGDVLNTTTWTMTTLDKVVQTESCRVLEVQKLWSFKVNKSQMAAPKLCHKTTQATLNPSSESSEEVSEFINFDSSNVTFVKPFSNRESDQAIDKLAKAWWGKSHSDSELYGTRRCGCLKPDYAIPLPQVCSCSQTTDAQSDQKNTVARFSDNSKVFRPDSKADKSLGTNDGSQRFYKRADKALGTDSGAEVPPEMSGRMDKALGTDSGVLRMNRRADKALGTDNELPLPSPKKADKSPRHVDYSSKAEQTSLDDDGPPTTLSDLSELTKMIQEFFEKTAIPSRRTCQCESSTVTQNKIVTTESTKSSAKEYVDQAVGAHPVHERKVDSEAMTDTPRKPRLEFANAETQASSSKGPPSNHPPNDRVRIRRSVLLDDNQTKTRFVCSVCAREISTYSMNAATNTESLHSSPPKKNKTPASVSTEISELLKIKTVRTVEGLDDPKRMTSAPQPTARPRTNAPTKKTAPPKTYIPTPQPPTKDYRKRTPTPAPTRKCLCQSSNDICTKDSCPNRKPAPAPTTSRPPPPRTDPPPGVPDTHTRSPRNRTMRRNLEPYYPVLIESPWPKDFSWNPPENSRTSMSEDSHSATSQKKSCERETEPADVSPGKKTKPEAEKSPGQYLMAPQDLRLGDRILFQDKAGFIVIPSLSASSVATSKKHPITHSKMIKSEERVQQEVGPPEGFNEPPDLSSTKSCRLTPIRLDCDDKLFECRVCKSLTFMKTDKDGVVFHWRHGVFTCRPTVLQYPNPTARRTRRDDSESLHRNESSTLNLDDVLRESQFSDDRSDSPSPYELLPEEAGETSEEEPEVKGPSEEGPFTLDDLLYSDGALTSKFWAGGYTRRE